MAEIIMESATKIQKEHKTYIFKIVVEPDPFPDGRMAYHAYCPALKDYAASTWGYTREEAVKNIQEVIQMIIRE
jgi:predicted RNase H-like HicB family nuclease